MTDDRTPTVAVVGAGAAGVMAAAGLLEALRASGHPHRVTVIGDAEHVGRGVAYGTTDERHVLNVPAGKMSADVDDPGDFVRWLRQAWRPDAGAGDFAPRALFGRYLADHLDTVAGDDGRLSRVRDRVIGLERCGTGTLLRLATGREVTADAVVLATGTPPPCVDWAPPTLARSPRFVGDPWVPGALGVVPEDEDVLVVGTGLTMVDVALSLARRGRVVHAVSRHGLVPRAHAETPLPGRTPVGLSPGAGLASLRAALRDHVRDSVRADGDWRVAIDGLRPITTLLWKGLTPDDRDHFLAHDLRSWEVLRHRLAPAVARSLAEARSSGLVRVGVGEVGDAQIVDGLPDVTLLDGRRLRVGAVVTATGAQADPSRTGDPLFADLLATGLAQVGPHRMGLRTTDGGLLVDGAGNAATPLWTLGASRRGMLFESTAFPEIRAQARALATELLPALPTHAAAPAPHRPGRVRDRYGLVLTTDPGTAAAWDRALQRILTVRSDAEDAVGDVVTRDPGFALGQATAALLAEYREDHEAAARALAEARRAAAHASDRERSFVHAVAELLDPAPTAGVRGTALLQHLGTWPRDALALSLAVPTIAFAGVSAGRDSWELVESLAPAYGDDGWFAAQLAFVRQDQARWDEAEDLAVRALAADPACGHAVHARTHVFYETGDHGGGLAWLDGWLGEHGPRARHRAHFSWHAALHELSLGDTEAVARRYASQLAPPLVTGSRALVDSASLIWRCRVLGVGEDLPIGPVLDAAPTTWLTAPPTNFAGMHAALALAAAGDHDGLQRLRRHCASRAGRCFAEAVAPLCAALADVVAGRWTVAALALGAVVPRMVECGGSAAQREVIEDTWIHALAAAGRGPDAARVLSDRLERRPSPLDRARLSTMIPNVTGP